MSNAPLATDAPRNIVSPVAAPVTGSDFAARLRVNSEYIVIPLFALLIAAALFARPRHPSSALLIAATPARARSVDALAGIPGQTPVLDADTPACRFADRCERAEPLCRTQFPPRRLDAEGHGFHCWRPL